MSQRPHQILYHYRLYFCHGEGLTVENVNDWRFLHAFDDFERRDVQLLTGQYSQITGFYVLERNLFLNEGLMLKLHPLEVLTCKLFFLLLKQMRRLVGKPAVWFPTRSDTNRPVQAQKRARSLKFRI